MRKVKELMTDQETIILAALAASGDKNLFDYYAKKFSEEKPKRRSAAKGEVTTVVITAPVHGNLYFGSTHIEGGQARKGKKPAEQNQGTNQASDPISPPSAPPTPQRPAPPPPPTPAPTPRASTSSPTSKAASAPPQDVEGADGVDDPLTTEVPVPTPSSSSGSPPEERRASTSTAPPAGLNDIDLDL